MLAVKRVYACCQMSLCLLSNEFLLACKIFFICRKILLSPSHNFIVFYKHFIVCEVSSNFLIQLKPASAGRSNTEYSGFMVLYTVVSFSFKYPSIHFPEVSFAADAVNVLKASYAIISVRIFEHFFINIIIKLILSLKRSVHTNRGYYYLSRSACTNNTQLGVLLLASFLYTC